MGNICYTTGKEPNILKLNLTEPISKIIYIEDNKTIKDLIKICIKEIKNEQKLLKCIKEESMKLICDNLDFIHVIKNKIIKETYPNFINDMES